MKVFMKVLQMYVKKMVITIIVLLSKIKERIVDRFDKIESVSWLSLYKKEQ